MPKYQVEMEDGSKYELELDQAVPEGDAGKAMLEQMVLEQLAEQETRQDFPAYRYGKQIEGGVYDAIQGTLIDTPMGILNAALQFVNPEPPGPGRQPPPYQVESPRVLPEVPQGETFGEKAVRLGTTILAPLAVGLGLKWDARRAAGVERVAIPKAQSTAPKTARFYPKMYEEPPGGYQVPPSQGATAPPAPSYGEVLERVVEPELREQGRRGARVRSSAPGADKRAVVEGKIEHQVRPPGEISLPGEPRPPVPTKATTVGGILDQPLSEAAARVAKSFDVPSVSAGYRNMTLREAYEAKTRILHRIAGDLEVAESLPVRELLERIEMVILSHR
jgi:hypothetical protein